MPATYDLRYRSPSAGDIFAWNDENLKKSHAILTEKLSALTGGGVIAETDGFTKCRTRSDYPYKTFITSITGQWRCDNDPPFPYLSDFVRAWNEKGLKPRLCLTTLSQAFEMLRMVLQHRLRKFAVQGRHAVFFLLLICQCLALFRVHRRRTSVRFCIIL